MSVVRLLLNRNKNETGTETETETEHFSVGFSVKPAINTRTTF